MIDIALSFVTMADIQGSAVKIENRKGLEAMGAVMSVCTAVFVLVCTSSAASSPSSPTAPEMNWLMHYSPDIAKAEVLPWYVTAVYYSTMYYNIHICI
jgi:hypothetical protein